MRADFSFGSIVEEVKWARFAVASARRVRTPATSDVVVPDGALIKNNDKIMNVHEGHPRFLQAEIQAENFIEYSLSLDIGK